MSRMLMGRRVMRCPAVRFVACPVARLFRAVAPVGVLSLVVAVAFSPGVAWGQSIQFSPTSISITEGEQSRYEVTLSAEPSDDVTVTITTPETAAGNTAPLLSTDPTTLTFSATTWNDAQTVSVTAEQDVDFLDTTQTITHAAESDDTNYDGESATLDVVVADDDGISVEQSITIEEGESGMVTMRFGSAPTQDTTITYTVTPADHDLTLSPDALVFTADNYQTAQNIMVAAGRDDDGDDDSANIAYSIDEGSGSVFSGFTITATEVTITDNYTEPVFTPDFIDPIFFVRNMQTIYPLPTASGGPSSGVTFTYSLTPDIADAVPGLVFNNTATARSISGAPTTEAPAVTLTYTARDEAKGINLALTFPVTVTGAPGLVVSTASLVVAESETSTYTLRLNSPPSGGMAGDIVTVTASNEAGTRTFSISPTALLFSAANWMTAQTFSVTGADDGATSAAEQITHRASVTGGRTNYHELDGPSVAVDVVDTLDRPRFPSGASPGSLVYPRGVAITPLVLPEAFGDDTPITYTLESVPSGAGLPNGLAFADTSRTLSGTPQAAEQLYTLRYKADDASTPADNDSFTFTVRIVNRFNPLALPPTLALTEGEAGAFTLRLASAPDASENEVVTVDIGFDANVSGARLGGPGIADGGLSGSVDFTADNWNEALPYSVFADEDDDIADSAGEITFTQTSSRAGFSGLHNRSSAIAITIDDTTADTRPTFGTGAMALALTFQQGQPVSETLPEAREGNGALSYSLTPSIITAVPGLSFDGTSREISGAPTTQAAAVALNYQAHDLDGSTNSDTFTVNITVSEPPPFALTFTPSTLTVAEGAGAMYMVALSAEPGAAVTVSTTQAPLSTTTSLGTPMNVESVVTFSATNWAMPQSLTFVGVAPDNTLADRDATLEHTLTGDAMYMALGANLRTLPVRVTNVSGVILDPATDLEVTEGMGGSYTIRLASQPFESDTREYGVTITPTSGAPMALSFTPASVRFTSSNWAMAQTVSVSSADNDSTSDNAAVTITHAATASMNSDGSAVTNSDYSNLPAPALTVAIANDDFLPGVRITPRTLAISEITSDTYSVSLQTAPDAGELVTVTPALPDGADSLRLTEDGSETPRTEIVFGDGNWSDAVVVQVRGVADDDSVEDMVVISHSVTNYGDVTAGPEVTVTIAETARVGFERAEYSYAEGHGIIEDICIVGVNTDDSAFSFPGGAVRAVTAGGTATEWDAFGPTDRNEEIADYIGSSGGSGFAASAGTRHCFRFITIRDDDRAEGGETFFVDLQFINAASTEYVLSPSRATVTITDGPGVGLTATELDVYEGFAATYGVSLGAQPDGEVTVTPAAFPDASPLSFSGGGDPLMFSTTNWSTAQTLTVTSATFADAASLDAVTISHTVENYTVTTGSGATAVITTVTEAPSIDITAVKSPTIQFGMTTREVAEDAGTLTFTLTADVPDSSRSWGGAVVRVEAAFGGGLSSANADDITFTPAMLTFDADGDSREVEVGVIDDSIGELAETFQLRLSLESGVALFPSPDASVTITDNEPPGVTLAPTALTLREGVGGFYTIRLDTPPPGDATVMVSADTAGKVSANPALASEIIFSQSNWTTARTVSITATADADTMDDTVALSHAVSGYGEVSDGGTVSVTVVEPIVVGFEMAAYTFNEPAATSVAEVCVAVTSPAAGVALRGGDITVNLNSGATGDTATPRAAGAQSGGDYAALIDVALTFSDTNRQECVDVTLFTDTQDEGDEQFTLALSGGRAAVQLSPASAVVTIVDDDRAELVFTPGDMRISETHFETYMVRLGAQPSENVTVTAQPPTGLSLTGADGGALQPLVFTPSNWASGVMVSVYAAPDSANEDEGAQIIEPNIIFISHEVSGGTSVADSNFQVRLYDLPDVRLITGSAATGIGEPLDSTGFYQRASQITVPEEHIWRTQFRIETPASRAVANGETVIGTPGFTRSVGIRENIREIQNEWGADPGTSLSGTSNADRLHVGISSQGNSPSNNYDGEPDFIFAVDYPAYSGGVRYPLIEVIPPAVTFTYTDDDRSTFTLSASALTVDEGSTGMYTLSVDKQPWQPVTVMAAVEGAGATISPAILTFTRDDTSATVTVTALVERAAGADTVTITHSAISGVAEPGVRGAGIDLAAPIPPVTVQIEDRPQVGFDTASTTVAEGATSGNICLTGSTTLIDNAAPAVYVRVATDSAGGDADFTFNDTADNVTDLTSSLGYRGVLVAFNNTANECFTITPGADGVTEGDEVLTLTLELAVPAQRLALFPRRHQITITDSQADIDAAGLTLTDVPLTVTENFGGGYHIELASQPNANVVITPQLAQASDAAFLTVDTEQLTFTADNWNTAQEVRVTGVADEDDIINTVMVSHAISGHPVYAALAAGDIPMATVAVIEAPVLAFVTSETDPTPVTGFTFTEGATADGLHTLWMRFVESPAGRTGLPTDFLARVTVTPNDPDLGNVMGTHALLLGREAAEPYFFNVEFGANKAQEDHFIQLADDAVVQGTRTFTLSMSSDAPVVFRPRSITLTVLDEAEDIASASVIFSANALTVTENARSAYTVRLGATPSEDVTVTPRSSDPARLRIDTGPLVFTRANWSAAQSVMVSGLVDSDRDAATLSITHAISGQRVYAALPPPELAATVTEAPVIGFVLSMTALTATDTYRVGEGDRLTLCAAVLDPPSGGLGRGLNARATITAGSAGADDYAEPGAGLPFTFIADDESLCQTMQISSDLIAEGDESFTVTLSAAEGSGVVFDPAVATVTITDDDSGGLTLTGGPLDLIETARGVYDIVLNAQPGSDVRVAPVVSDAALASVSPSALVFTGADWNVAQTFTVTAGLLGDGVDSGSLSITHRVTGNPIFAALPAAEIPSVDVTIRAAPRVGFSGAAVSDGITRAEGGNFSDICAVALDPPGSLPSAVYPVTFTFTATPVSDGITEADYNFRGSGAVATATSYSVNLSTPGQVPCFGLDLLHDSISEGDETLLVTLSANMEIAISPASIRVTITDEQADLDAARASISPSTLSVGEAPRDATGVFTVSLNVEPGSNVTVTPVQPSNAPLRVDTTPLVFTPADWNTPQTVTVTGQADLDNRATPVVVTVEVSGNSAFAAQNFRPSTVVTVTEAQVVMAFSNPDGTLRNPYAYRVNEGTGVFVSAGTTRPPFVDALPFNFRMRLGASDGSATSGDYAFPSPTVDDPDLGQTLPFNAGNRIRSFGEVRATEDLLVEGDEIFYLSMTATDNRVTSFPPRIPVTIVDNDSPDITIGGAPVTVNEESSAVYTITFNNQPGRDVTVYPTADDSARVRLEPESLVFATGGNWNVTREVTVYGMPDADIDDNDFSITHRMAGPSPYTRLNLAVAVRVVDLRRAGLVINPNPLAGTEGGFAAYRASLASEPTGTVVLTATSGDTALASFAPPTEAAVDTATLMFTRDNWSSPQPLTLFFPDETDATDTDRDSVDISHAFSGADSEYNDVSAPVLRVNIDDNDVPGLTVRPLNLNVVEGEAETYTLQLNTQPSAAVNVALASSTTEKVTVSPASLEFAPGAWNTPQTVTVTALFDDDDVNDVAQITNIASGGDYTGQSATTGVTVIDRQAVVVSWPTRPQPLQLAAGTMISYSVVLLAQPSGDVVVAPASGSAAVVSAVGAALTFTADNWDRAQRITITAADGAVENDSTSVTHMVSGANYGSTPASSVPVTIGAPLGSVDIMPSDLRVALDAGTVGGYSVVLGTEPSGDVFITPRSSDSAVAIVTGALTFTRANWNVAQSVAVRIPLLAQTDQRAVISHTVTGSNYASVTAEDVNVVVLLPSIEEVRLNGRAEDVALEITEGGSAQYTLSLSRFPTGNLTIIPIALGPDGETINAAPPVLMFTPDNWEGQRVVRLSAAETNDSFAHGSALIRHALLGASYAGGVAPAVAVTLFNNDPRAELSVSELALREGRMTSYSVSIASAPVRGDVVITPRVSSGGSPLRFNGGSRTDLRFTTDNWREPQVVNVLAVDNDVSGDSQVAVVSHRVSGGGYGGAPIANINARITDDDIPSLVFAPEPLAVVEGASAEYGVALKLPPALSMAVEVTPRAADASLATAAAVTLTFSATNWDTPQMVSVTAADDTGGRRTQILHALTGASEYTAASAATPLEVVIGESPGVTLSTANLVVGEGAEASYGVTLDTAPVGGDVMVTPASSDTAVATVDATPLVFTAVNWNVAQQVAVSGVHDPDTEDSAANITHTVTGADYGGVTVAPLAVRVTDDDSLAEGGLALSVNALELTEGERGSYTLALDTQPPGAVVVRMSAPPAVRIFPPQLNFTRANWNTPQPVGVEALQNAAFTEVEAVISHSASGGYGGALPQVAVTVLNNDPRLLFSATSLALNEGSTTYYTIALASRPSANVDVGARVSAGLSSRVTLNGDQRRTTLVFSPTNWRMPQSVVVAAVDDARAFGDASLILAHSVRGGGYGALRTADVPDVSVRIADNDAVGVAIAPLSLSVDEGGAAASYGVVLRSAPSAVVRVTPAAAAGSDLSLNPSGALQFSAANWNVVQSVAVSAGHDSAVDDGGANRNDRAQISHSVRGGDYQGVAAASVAVAVTDDDVPGVVVSETDISLAESGGMASYTIVLQSAPGGAVRITPSATGAGAAVLNFAPPTLVFTADDWNAPKGVTVSTAADADIPGFEDNDAVIRHSISGADYGGVAVADVGATVLNDDAGLLLSARRLQVEEGGDAVAYGVSLALRPTANVTVTLSPTPANRLTLAPSGPLEFSAANWNTAQSVMVSGTDNSMDEPDMLATISHAVASTDTRYAGDDVDAPAVAVTVVDDDEAEIRLYEMDGAARLDGALFIRNSGGTATYGIALGSMPSDIVTVTLNAGALSVSPNVLTFPADDWDEVQFVTASATPEQRTVGIGATNITHSASGAAAEYTGATATALVTVVPHGVGRDIPTSATGSGTAADPLIVRAGSPQFYTMQLATQPSGNVTVALVVERTDGNRAANTATDTPAVTAEPMLPSGDQIVFTTANWNVAQTVTIQPVPDGADDSVGRFQVSFEFSGAPEYDGRMIAPLVFEVPPLGIALTDADGNAISAITLRPGGSAVYQVALNYVPTAEVNIMPASGSTSVTVSPATLEFPVADWENTVLTVMVTANADAEDTTISHSATGGNYAGRALAGLRVTISSGEGFDQLNRTILPELARAIADQQISAIAARTRDAQLANGGARLSLAGQSTVAGFTATQMKSLVDGKHDFKKMLAGSDFVMPLSGDGGGGGNGGLSGAAFWGGGDYRSLGGESGALDWDGDLFTFHLGFDARIRPGMLAGVLLSHSNADIDYSGGVGGSGDYEMTHSGVNPYIGWSALGGRLDLWATVGFGSGEVEDSATGGDNQSADFSTQMTGIGGGGILKQVGATELRLNAEAFASKADVDATATTRARSLSANRMRVALEARRTHAISEGTSIAPSAEIGIRTDGGDGETGSGIEVGGGLHYQNAARGLSLAAQARALFAHSADTTDWGISSTLKLTPGADRQGLSLTLTPAYGNPSSRAQTLWNDGILGDDDTDTRLRAKMDLNIAYGLTHRHGLLTPYTELTLGENNQAYRLGLRFELGKTLDLKLFSERLTKDNTPKDTYLLKGQVSF